MHIYCICIYININIYMYICIYVYRYVCIYVYTLCKYCMYVLYVYTPCMYCMYVRMYVYSMYAYIYISINVYAAELCPINEIHSFCCNFESLLYPVKLELSVGEPLFADP